MALADALDPKSQYRSTGHDQVQGSAPDKLGAAADRLAALDPNNEVVLLGYVTKSAMTSKQMDKAIASASTPGGETEAGELFGCRLAEKREGVGPEDGLLDRPAWVTPLNKLAQADQNLRAALPPPQGRRRADADRALQSRAGQLHGWGGKKALAADAARFNDQAAAILRYYTAQAAKMQK